MKKYLPTDIEKKWQSKWSETELYKFDPSDKKGQNYYNLVELPYTSGDLHLGHWFAFTPPDAHARYRRMLGLNVFYPVGFDAFGLPAENAAIKRSLHPEDWTLENVANMKRQFETMGSMIDWSHTLVTCMPEYYRWNQWIFLKMFDKGIAYLDKALLNWCPFDQTVLADENIEGGKCWRCGHEVTKKEVEEWFLKLTAYAERLIWPETPEVDWPKSVRTGQNNWIGKKEGCLVKFENIEVFTTRPDTIFGVTFLVVSPEHPLLESLVKPDKKTEVDKYLEQVKRKTELERKENKDKTGVFTGSTVKNPLSNDDVPVWVADYVLADFGTGAVMGVPGHDQRDFEFADKFGLPVKIVIEPVTGDPKPNEEFRKSIVAAVINPRTKEVLSINWGPKLGGSLLIGGGVEEGEDLVETAKREITEETGYTSVRYINQTEKIHHHYFAASKNSQREIEAVGLLFELENENKVETKLDESEKGKFEVEWVSQNDLESRIMDPLHKYVFQRLIKNAIYDGEGVVVGSGDYSGMSSSEAREKITSWIEEKSLGKAEITYHLRDWSISRQRYWGTPVPIIHCDKCGLVPVPESDLPVKLPREVDFTPKGKPPLASNEDWLKVNCPKCGSQAQRDAQTLDGFFDNSWYFFRYINPNYDLAPFDPDEAKEVMPVDIYFGGAEHTLGHTLYARFFTKFFKELGLIEFDEFALRRVQHGVVLGPDGNRMSKSKGNVVNPDDVVVEYGADTVRVYLCFMMPYIDTTAPWSTTAIAGIYRFLNRIWGLIDKVEEVELNDQDLSMINLTIKKVGDDISQIHFNTAIAALMEWLNYLSRKEKVSKVEYKTFLLLLAPFAPHVTEELWELVGENYSIHNQKWPEIDISKLDLAQVKIAVQINGKVRDVISASSEVATNQSEIEKLSHQSKKIEKYLKGNSIKNVIFVPKKIINFILA